MLRPTVPVTLIGTEQTPGALALVDSGCEHVLVSQGLARAAGLDFRASNREIRLGIGGGVPTVRFVDATLRLHPDGADDDVYVEWQAEIGVIREWKPTFQVLLGQVGFLDRFTVTMSRHAQELAIEGVENYDSRFGIRHLRR